MLYPFRLSLYSINTFFKGKSSKMASLKAVVRTNKTKSDGTAPIAIRLSHRQKTKYIWLKRYINPKNWDANRQKAKGMSKAANELNVLVNKLKSNYQSIVDKLEVNQNSYTLEEIADGIDIKQNGKQQICFHTYLENFIINNPENLSFGTLKKYKTIQTHLKKFAAELSFEDITVEFLSKLELHFKDNFRLKVNSIHCNLKFIRKLMIKEYNLGNIKDHPFKKFKLKKEQTKRDYLTADEIKSIEEHGPTNPSQHIAKDLFVFALYTGLRFFDICFITPDNIIESTNVRGDKVHKLYFTMSKTGDSISFKLPNKAFAILQKYNLTDDSQFIFPVINLPPDSTNERLIQKKESRNAYINKILKEIAAAVGITKNVSFHISRHSFATKALTLGINMEVVSKLLGHADLKTTQIYAKIVDKAKDDAMDLFN